MTLTILYTVRNSYCLLRLSLESLFAYIPEENYDEILIVDDCSTQTKLYEYYKYLQKNPKFKIITNTPRPYSYYTFRNTKDSAKQQFRKNNKNKISLGHGSSINIGLDNCSSDYVLSCDSDVFFLPKSKNLISRMLECFNLDEKIMSVGQLVGKVDGIKVIDKTFKSSRDTNNTFHGGKINSVFMISKMDGWNKHKLKKMYNGGWAHSLYADDIFNKKFKTCNFNTFKDGYIIHLGHGTLGNLKKRNMGFVKDKTYYGSVRGNNAKTLNEWYAGYHFIKLKNNEFKKILIKYLNLSFDTRLNLVPKIVDKKLLV